MLRIVQNSAAAGAKSYYSTADYYTEGQELAGVWRGLAAERLGLEGTIGKRDWDALCDNLDPHTGRTLTARQKETRRVGYDFNFHAPKSVSLLYGMSGDERIVEAFRGAVDATMRDMEAEMKARVRAGGMDEDRTTGNMAWGEFVHFTARPVEGVPDPHLHAHCFVFNTTWDDKESRWKAGQFAGLKHDAPYFEAVFHSRLARAMEELGLATRRTRKGWELKEVSDSAVRAFSRRTALIEETAKARGIEDPEAKGELGATTRERKRSDVPLQELRDAWTSRLSAEDGATLRSLADGISGRVTAESRELASEAVDRAIDHCFERNSVMPERRVLREALRRSFGAAGPEMVHLDFDSRGLLSAERDGERVVTTPEVLAEERRMISFARDGRGSCRRLGGGGEHEFGDKRLSRGQVASVLHVLNSRDRVILIRGPAGTGKTTMMREAVAGIESNGTRVFTFAPSADASRKVLRDEGFDGADTVARLLLDERVQEEVRGNAIWVDEAGLLGSRTMLQVFDLAGRLDARVILSGDRRQHGPVERGAALRLLEQEAGLRPAQLREIRRQHGEYRDAVQSLSEGDVKGGLEQLDRLGWVRELPEEERYDAMADDYVAAVEAGKSALVVSPTHAEGNRITGVIRSRLREVGRLGGDERSVPTLENAHFTHAERLDSLNYEPGDVLVFHQNAKGFTKGQRIAADGGPLPLDQTARFDVFYPGSMRIAPGDLVRITRNGTTADGAHRLNNGAVYTVKGFSRGDDLVLENGWRVAKDFGFLSYGYVSTSHASQGKTVDRVLIGQSGDSYPASSKEQLYVSVSRGREQATIYTDDKAALLAAVQRSADKMAATDLVGGRGAQAVVARRAAEMSYVHPERTDRAREERAYDR